MFLELVMTYAITFREIRYEIYPGFPQVTYINVT
jgi:hypothetical protein